MLVRARLLPKLIWLIHNTFPCEVLFIRRLSNIFIESIISMYNLGEFNKETGYFSQECRHSSQTIWFRGCPITRADEGLQMRGYEGIYHTFVNHQRIPDVDWGIYYDGSNHNWWEAVCHELTHYLQDYVGCKIQGGNKLASLSKGGISIPPVIKECYPREDWVVEAEALFCQKNPYWLMKLFDQYRL